MEYISLTRAGQAEALRGIGIYRWQEGGKGSIRHTVQPSFFGFSFFAESVESEKYLYFFIRETTPAEVALLPRLPKSELSNHGEKVWFPLQTVTHRGQRSGQNLSDYSFRRRQLQLHVHFHHRYVALVKFCPCETSAWPLTNVCWVLTFHPSSNDLMPSSAQTGFLEPLHVSTGLTCHLFYTLLLSVFVFVFFSPLYSLIMSLSKPSPPPPPPPSLFFSPSLYISFLTLLSEGPPTLIPISSTISAFPGELLGLWHAHFCLVLSPCPSHRPSICVRACPPTRKMWLKTPNSLAGLGNVFIRVDVSGPWGCSRHESPPLRVRATYISHYVGGRVFFVFLCEAFNSLSAFFSASFPLPSSLLPHRHRL